MLRKIINNERGESAISIIAGGIGAVVGFIYGGPMGAFKGFMIGYGLGSIAEALTFSPPELPSLGDSSATYQGTRPRNTIQEGIPIPRAYGRCRLAGNKVRVNDPDDSDYRMIVAHCLGPVSGPLLSGTSYEVNDVEWNDLKGTHYYTNFTGTTTQTYDTDINTKHTSATTSAYRGIAYTAFNFEKVNEVGWYPNITTVGDWLKCTPIGEVTSGASNRVFSRNPAVVMYDWYINVEGYTYQDLNIEKFRDLETYCDEQLSGTSRYTFDYVFDTKTSINDAKKIIWSSFNGCCIYDQGKIKPAWESAKADVLHKFDESNIVRGSFSFTKPRVPNTIKVYYIDGDNKWEKTSVVLKNEESIRTRGEIVYSENCWFINNGATARRRAQFIKEKAESLDWKCSLTAFSDSSHLEPYDRVQVTHQEPGWTEKDFIVRSKIEDGYGRCQFELDAFYAGIYHGEEAVYQKNYASYLPKIKEFSEMQKKGWLVVGKNNQFADFASPSTAIEHITATRSLIYIKEGTYTFDNKIVLPDKSFDVIGESRDGVILENKAGVDLFVGENLTKTIKFSNFSIKSQNVATYSNMFYFGGTDETTSKPHIQISGVSVILIDDGTFGIGGDGDSFINCQNWGSDGSCLIDGCRVKDGFKAVNFSNITADVPVEIKNSTIISPTYMAITYASNGNVVISGNTFKDLKNYGVYVTGVKADILRNNFFATGSDHADEIVGIRTNSTLNKNSGNRMYLISTKAGIRIYGFYIQGDEVSINDNIIWIDMSSIDLMYGVFMTGANDGVINGNHMHLDNDDNTDNHYGVYFNASSRNVISGNHINLVNNDAKDIGILLDANSDNNQGGDNVTYLCGTGIDDTAGGAGNAVTGKDI